MPRTSKPTFLATPIVGTDIEPLSIKATDIDSAVERLTEMLLVKRGWNLTTRKHRDTRFVTITNRNRVVQRKFRVTFAAPSPAPSKNNGNSKAAAEGKKYLCVDCGHVLFRHRESREWQLNNPRRKRNLVGCTEPGCKCQAAKQPLRKGQIDFGYGIGTEKQRDEVYALDTIVRDWYAEFRQMGKSHADALRLAKAKDANTCEFCGTTNGKHTNEYCFK